MIRVVQRRGIKPTITSSTKKMSTSQIIAAFITILNRPRVNILKGRVISFRIGLMKKLIRPKISPAINRVFQLPVNSTPEINWLAIHNPKIPEVILRKRFRIFI